MAEDDSKEPFPWDVGIFDSHCHPTDTMASIPLIPKMKARALTVMSTRSQDQDLVSDTVSKLAAYTGPDDNDTSHKIVPSFGWHPWFSHQIYDDTEDDTTNTTNRPTPSKSEHYASVLTPTCTKDPSFINSLPDPRPLSAFLRETEQRLQSHPHALVGEVGLDRSFRLPLPWTAEEQQQRDASYTEGAREGRSLSAYRVRLGHQKAVLKAQLRLAGKLGRPVSVHSVQGHGGVFEVLHELWAGHEKEQLSKRQRKRRGSAPNAHAHAPADSSSSSNDDHDDKDDPPDSLSHTTASASSTSDHHHHHHLADIPQPLPFPPRICMHSYSGPAEPLRQFLQATNPATIYFSFSYAINFSGAESGGTRSSAAERAEAVMRAVPDDRILVESDFHTAGDVTDGYLEWIVRKVCEVKGWGLREGARRLRENWWAFVFGGVEG